MSDVALQLIEEAREKKLLKLDLGRCDLKEIPEQIFELSWLKQLNLGAQYWNPVSNQFQKTDNGGLENSISILPKGLKRLKSLKALTISNNSFRYDPIIDIQIIRSLPKLTLLELCFGKIENIDPLASLSNLQVLNLTANSVQDLTPLQNLTKLTYLFLGANEIRELEPLSKLRNLRHLALSQNRISNILAISELVNK